MATPVRNGIELDTMGELHLVLLVKPPLLLFPLGVFSRCLFGPGVLSLI